MRPKRPLRLTIIAASGVLIVFVIGLLTVGSRRGHSGVNPRLPISLVGFTNGTSGARLAIFEISNVLSRQIEYSPGIDFKDRGTWLEASSRPWPPKLTASASQQSFFFVTNPIEGTWRVSVLYELKPNLIEKLGWNVRRLFGHFGLYLLAKKVPTGEMFKAYMTYGPEMTD